jgi:DNA-binding CsgD family transcriptional regulator
MGQVMNGRARHPERLEQVADAMGSGVILVASDGTVLWTDRATRRRLNGELGRIPLPVPRPEGDAVDCFAVPLELSVNGKPLKLCIIQQTDEARSSNELIAAIESIVADGSSWLASVVDKLKGMRQGDVQMLTAAPKGASNTDLNVLSDREREVLGLICEGKGDTQMSELLGLSENTVRNHIASLYRKIGVNRRTAAIIWARERGIHSLHAVSGGLRRRNGDGRNGSATY